MLEYLILLEQRGSEFHMVTPLPMELFTIIMTIQAVMGTLEELLELRTHTLKHLVVLKYMETHQL